MDDEKEMMIQHLKDCNYLISHLWNKYGNGHWPAYQVRILSRTVFAKSKLLAQLNFEDKWPDAPEDAPEDAPKDTTQYRVGELDFNVQQPDDK